MRQLLLLTVLATGCTMAQGSLTVTREGLDPDVVSSIERLDIWLLDGSRTSGEQVVCEPLLDQGFEPDSQEYVVKYRESFRVGREVPQAIGHLGEGRVVFFVQAVNAQCGVVARGCADVNLRSGQNRDVDLPLTQLSVVAPCPSEQACVDAVCRPCEHSNDCDDGNPCTVGSCGAGTCSHAAAELDEDNDSYGSSLCGGPDCDDGDQNINPGADRRCGLALDHNCDGIVDDLQGCGTCSGARGMSHVTSLEVPATGLSVLDNGPEDKQVFVSTSNSINVYQWDGSTFAELGQSRIDGVTPHAAVLLGEHALVADREYEGVLVFSVADLVAGSAEPRHRVGQIETPNPQLTALFATTTAAYLSTGDGSLYMLDLAGMPQIRNEIGGENPNPVRALDNTYWGGVFSMSLVGGSLFGTAYNLVTWARIDGAEVTGGHTNVGGGVAQDLYLDDSYLYIAKGDRGIVVLPQNQVIDAGISCCDGRHELPLPVGCQEGVDCQNSQQVAPAGEDRAVILAVEGGGGDADVYLVNTADPANMSVVAHRALSNSDAGGTDVWVSGSTVFVAATVLQQPRGVVDVFRLDCP